ncbi:MAG TPA: lipase family protein, partial [Verrucomicrobiae bacterium]|nr:lipase family protein [Verrucomicrobiae bacterium]
MNDLRSTQMSGDATPSAGSAAGGGVSDPPPPALVAQKLPSEGGFDIAMARASAAWSKRAYEEADISDAETDTHAIVRDCGSYVVIAVRGTASLHNFLEDADVWKVPFVSGKVHHGFEKCWNAIEVQVIQLALTMTGGGKPLYITGHSLGGAIAALIADRWTLLSWPITSVYTFGQPRVGDKQWAHTYDLEKGSRTFRVVNEEDIVPRVPGVLAGFRHCGQEIFFAEL